MGDGGEELDLLGHALGQGLHLLARRLAEAVPLQHRVGALEGRGLVHPVEAGDVGHGLARGLFLVETPLLGEKSDASEGVRAGRRAEEFHRALGGPHDAKTHPDRRGLAGAVGTQKPHDLPGLNGKGDIADGIGVAKAFADVLEAESGHRTT